MRKLEEKTTVDELEKEKKNCKYEGKKLREKGSQGNIGHRQNAAEKAVNKQRYWPKKRGCRQEVDFATMEEGSRETGILRRRKRRDLLH